VRAKIRVMDDLPAIERQTIESSLPPDAAARLLAQVRPAVALVRASPGTPVVGHLGGRPRLDPDDEWPACLDTPLSLLAVLDLGSLAHLSAGTGVPRSGILNFFYEADEQPWGFDPADRGAWRVLPADPETAQPRAEPPGTRVFAEVPLRAARIPTFPGWEEDVTDAIMGPGTPSVDDRYIAVSERLEAGAPAGPKHRLGGWPDLEQAPWQLECQLASHGLYVGDPEGYLDPRAAELKAGAADWIMLAQIDSDDDAGWMWGDVGKLYYAIRRQDLGEAAFERVWLVLQCG
jgi:uncharacterized protein YwqG